MEQAVCGIAAETIQFTLAEASPAEGVLRVRPPARLAAAALSIDDLFPAAGRIELEVHGGALRVRAAEMC
jgi:hypothetical protein